MGYVVRYLVYLILHIILTLSFFEFDINLSETTPFTLDYMGNHYVDMNRLFLGTSKKLKLGYVDKCLVDLIFHIILTLSFYEFDINLSKTTPFTLDYTGNRYVDMNKLFLGTSKKLKLGYVDKCIVYLILHIILTLSFYEFEINLKFI